MKQYCTIVLLFYFATKTLQLFGGRTVRETKAPTTGCSSPEWYIGSYNNHFIKIYRRLSNQQRDMILVILNKNHIVEKLDLYTNDNSLACHYTKNNGTKNMITFWLDSFFQRKQLQDCFLCHKPINNEHCAFYNKHHKLHEENYFCHQSCCKKTDDDHDSFFEQCPLCYPPTYDDDNEFNISFLVQYVQPHETEAIDTKHPLGK